MATVLYLRDTEESEIGSPLYRDLRTTPGSSAVAGFATSVSGDALNLKKPFKKEIGETNDLVFISGRVPAGGFTLSGLMTFSVWGSEGSMNSNAGLACTVHKRTAAGVETQIGAFDDNVEMGTGLTEMTWTGTPTSTAFAENDRIVIKILQDQVAISSATSQSEISYNAASGATGDSFVQITENVDFKADIPSILGGSVIDANRDFTDSFTDIIIDLDGNITKAGIAVGDDTAVHGLTIERGGVAKSTQYRSGSGTPQWVLRVPEILRAGDTITISYDGSGDLLNAIGQEVSIVTDLALTNSLTKRIRRTLKDSSGAAITTACDIMIFALAGRDSDGATWMQDEQKQVNITPDGSGNIDFQYTGSVAGGTANGVYIAVFNPRENASAPTAATRTTVWLQDVD